MKYFLVCLEDSWIIQLHHVTRKIVRHCCLCFLDYTMRFSHMWMAEKNLQHVGCQRLQSEVHTMGTLLLNKWTHVYLLMKYLGRSPIFYFWAFNVTVARCSIQCDSWFCFCYYSTFQINDALRSLIVTSVFWRFVEPVGLPLEKMSGIKCRNSEAYRRCKHLHYCRLFEILGSCCFFDVMFTQVFLSFFLSFCFVEIAAAIQCDFWCFLWSASIMH